jgi:hypothetical protein
MAKLSWHLQDIPGWAREIINNDPVKLIDPPSDNPLPGRKIIGRVYMDDSESNALIAQGVVGAAEWWERVRPLMTTRPYVWAWCLPNEPQPVANWDFCNLLADFTIAAAKLMHAHSLPVIGGELAEGNPGGATDTERANLFCAIARGLAACDYWSQHAYWVPDGYAHPEAGYNQWHALRYQKNRGYARARGIKLPPVILTEAGWDFGIVDKPREGWRSHSTWPIYFADLKRFDADLRADSDCLGATIFVSGGNLDWRDFEIGESESRELAAYVAAAPPPVITVPTLAERLRAAFGAQFHDLRATLPTHATLKYQRRPLSAIQQIILHHTATAQTTTWQTVAAYHVNTRGWPGIAYHVGIHADGRVSLLNDPETISYHAGTANGSGVSISVMGNYETDTVNAMLWQRILAVKAVLDAYMGRTLPMIGHRDAAAAATVCPGRHLYAKLKPEEPPMANDPRAANCRKFMVDAQGEIVGIELVVKQSPSAMYECYRAEMLDPYHSGGNAVAKAVALDANNVEVAETIVKGWPYPTLDGDGSPALSGNSNNEWEISSKFEADKVIGPLAFYIIDTQGRIISDIVAGYGQAKGYGHIGGRVTFRLRGTVAPPIVPPTGNLELDIRNLAYNNVGKLDGVPYNPTLAFPLAAMRLNLGAPQTLELRQLTGYVVQGFAAGILYCQDGDWSHIQKLTW